VKPGRGGASNPEHKAHTAQPCPRFQRAASATQEFALLHAPCRAVSACSVVAAADVGRCARAMCCCARGRACARAMLLVDSRSVCFCAAATPAMALPRELRCRPRLFIHAVRVLAARACASTLVLARSSGSVAVRRRASAAVARPRSAASCGCGPMRAANWAVRATATRPSHEAYEAAAQNGPGVERRAVCARVRHSTCARSSAGAAAAGPLWPLDAGRVLTMDYGPPHVHSAIRRRPSGLIDARGPRRSRCARA